MTTGAPPPLLIYTDASFDGNSRTGSWGAVVRKQEHEVHLHGQFKLECADSTVAELRAIGNAIHKAADLAEPGAHITVYSDCLPAIHALNGKSKFRKSRDQLRATLRMVQIICEDSGRRITFRWIKGHQPKDTTCPHAQGNRLADKLARDAHNGLVARRAVQAAKRKRYKANRRVRLARAREEALAMASTPATGPALADALTSAEADA